MHAQLLRERDNVIAALQPLDCHLPERLGVPPNCPLLRHLQFLSLQSVPIAQCLNFGVQSIVEVAANFPEACRYVLEMLGTVYKYDAEAHERKLMPEERLRFHQQHSAPVMEKLQEWMEAS